MPSTSPSFAVYMLWCLWSPVYLLQILYCGTVHTVSTTIMRHLHIYKEQTQLITWPHSKDAYKMDFSKDPGNEATTNYATNVILSDDPNKSA